MPARVRPLSHVLVLFVLLFSTFSAPLVPALAASNAPRSTLDASRSLPPQAVTAAYTLGWVNTYKYPTGQPLCTGVAIVNQFFGGEECGFGIFTLSPADDNKLIDVSFRDQSGTVFHTEEASYDVVDDEYSVAIQPESDWPVGPITLEAVMRAPDTGSASFGFFLNTLHLVGEVDAASYQPGDAVTVSGTVSRRTGPGNAPVDLPVEADLTVQLVDHDSETVLDTQTTTAATITGDWDVTFPGGVTNSFGSFDYRVRVLAEWTDPSAASGPADWTGDLNLIAPFDAGDADLILSATQTATDGVVRPNQTYLTVLRVENPTTEAATSLTVTAVLPGGAVYLPGSTVPAATGGAGTEGDPLYWTFANLAAEDETAIYLYARAKTQAEDNTIVWQLLNLEAEVHYTHDAQAKSASATSLGPKVAPVGEVGDTVRHGQRPFPVALVDYVDIKHDAANTGSYFKNDIFPVLIERYQEMSFGQLLPVPVLPSVGVGDVRYDETPGAEYRWSHLQPNGFCSGVTTAISGTTGAPTGATYRIQDEWYQLPGTQGYYGSDSTGNNYLGALTAQPALVNVDNGCGPTGKLAYDAATLMDPDLDYNDFDSDRDGWVDFFELVYAGQPQNILGETGANNVWPHSSSLEYYYPGGYISHDQLRNHQDQPLYWTNADETAMTTSVTAFPVYVKVGPYNVNAEFSDEITFSHEYGHSLGLPDNYSLGTRETMGDWDLMASGEGHMSLWDKQELGWIVPTVLTSSLSVAAQTEVKEDTGTIHWRDAEGDPYTLNTGVHNAEVYKVELPKVELFDPAIIPSGDWVYYSQAGNDFGYPGHIFDIAFDANLTAGASALQLRFRSWYEIEKDYDYGYVQVSTDGGSTWTNLASGQGTTGNTNPNGTNHGNGITCVSGDQGNPLCGTVSYPEPAFITDTFDLSAYAGEDFILRWAYSTDPGLAMRGWVIDDIALLADGDEVFFDDAEDPIVSNDDTHVYNGWLRSNGSGTAEHAYWIGVRDRTGFDAATSFQPGVVMEYANESHGYGNVGVDNPPALTVLDSQPTPGSDTPGLDDAAWRPFPLDPGNRLVGNRDLFTDCGDPSYADGPRHVENYSDANQPDSLWLFDYQRLSMLVSGLAGEGSALTAAVHYQVPAVCGSKPGDAMLTISKTDAPDPVRAGRNLTYTLTVVNGGQSTASNVVVTDTVPADTTYVSCDGAACSQSAGVVTWQVGTLIPGSHATLRLVVTVSAGASNGSQITNSAYGVDSDDTAPVGGDPVVTTVTTSAVPELLLSKTASSNLIGPSQRLTYTISLVNAGQASASVVSVTDEIPANTTYISCGGAVCVPNGNSVEWVVGTLAQNATATLTLVVEVQPNTPGGVFIANSVYTVDSAETNVVNGAPVLTWVGYLVRLPIVFR